MAASAAGMALLHPSASNASENKLVMPRGVPNALVVQNRSRYLVEGTTVHRPLLAEMVDSTLRNLTRTSNIAEAWRTILDPGDVIGLKFNRSAQSVIGTTPAMAEALITSLINSGWSPQQIVCIEAPASVSSQFNTAPPRLGYDREETDFGSGSDEFARVLGQVSAIINIPYLKDHNIAGMTCALKNLSHGLVKHPARYHRNGCAPYIADIVAAEPIRSRLRLTIVDALRVVYDHGPVGTPSTIADEGSLLASFDPVALDAVSLAILNRIRNENGLAVTARTPADLPYLAEAHRRGLGIALSHGINSMHLGDA